ncbi:MAG: septum formation protein Maf [Bacteroidetes bacterium]|nr:septum formation protein Maf [Bacteroidota bacterium]
MKLNNQLVLGSASPRRKELLERLGFSFTIRTANADEIYPSNLNPMEVAAYLAKLKADSIMLYENELLITSDTVVDLDGVILEKPANANHALTMLSELSGKEHWVHTGACLRTVGAELSFIESTLVKMKNLSQEEITYYVNEYKPFDKAGAYGIQEWIGLIGVEYIRGCFYNVMGLPVQRIYQGITHLDER